MARHFDASAPDFTQRFTDFLAEPRDGQENLGEAVRSIIDAVKELSLIHI